MKKWLQRLFIFVFIFAFVFGDFANTGVFSKGTLQVQAAEITAQIEDAQNDQRLQRNRT